MIVQLTPSWSLTDEFSSGQPVLVRSSGLQEADEPACYGPADILQCYPSWPLQPARDSVTRMARNRPELSGSERKFVAKFTGEEISPEHGFDILTPLDNSKRYRAKVRSVLASNFGDDPDEFIEVTSSCDCPDSSYGLQYWIDEDGASYGQITLSNPFYEVFDIEELPEDPE
jgi:hypothetical protein